MFKKIASFLAVLTLMVSPALSTFANVKPPRTKFERNFMNATFALYVEKYGEKHFTCSATAYEKIKGGYLLISAGHCIDGRDNLNFYVRTDVDDALPYMPVTVVKYALTETLDFSILELDTKNKYPTIQIGSEEDLAVGDAIENVSFALGIAKQFNNGYVATDLLHSNEETNSSAMWLLNHFLVEVDGGPGSSGSAIVSKEKHQIVGLLVSGISGEQVGHGIIPMSEFYAFRADPKWTAHHLAPLSNSSVDYFSGGKLPIALCCNKDIAGSIQLAWQYVGYGRSNQEACFAVNENEVPGPIRLGDVPESCALFINPPKTLAIFHTHPLNRSGFPSGRDITIAKRDNVLMYVIQGPWLVEYNPKTDKIRFVACYEKEG
jgi:hypothetical protein